jgi:hypothetical protein
MLLALHRH